VTRGRLRRAAGGVAGVWIALGLAGVAGLTSFVATAGPREITVADNRAIDRTVTGLAPAQASFEVSTSTLSAGRSSWVTAGQQAAFGAAVQKLIRRPIRLTPGASRAFEQGPPGGLELTVCAPSAHVPDCIASRSAKVVLSADSDLQADARLVAGSWPGPSRAGVPGASAADRAGLTEPVAVPVQVAQQFGLHPGSVMTLLTPADARIDLVVSGIIAANASSLFWSTGAGSPAPYRGISSPGSFTQTSVLAECREWAGSVVVGSAGLTGLAEILVGHGVEESWYWPVDVSRLRAAQVGPLSSAVSVVATDSLISEETAVGLHFYSFPTLSSQLPGVLAGIQAQLATIESLDDLVIGGLFAAGLLLMLLCAALVADRYAAEFALVRARGGSMAQVVGSALRRSTGAGLPGTAAGVAVAVLAVRTASTSMAGWVLPALTALIAIGSAPAICAWRVRRGTAGQPGARADLTIPRRSARRLVAEAAIVVVTAAAVTALLVRGTGTGSNQLAFACPALLAATAAIIAARLYPVPIRALLPVAGTARGPVTFLGLTGAGRSRLRALMPAATLVLTMTLAVLGWLLILSVRTGEVASSWAQTGADAVFTAPGAGTVTATDLHAVAAVPGVTHTAAIYASGSGTGYAPTLTTATGSTVATGIAVVSPGPYAALAATTPWPRFPAARLSPRSGPVPILISPQLAAQLGPTAGSAARRTLTYFGQHLAVTITGTASQDTPAFPQGGSYIVYPQWAAPDIPALPAPDTLLAAGSGIPAARLAAIAARMHGFQLTTRQALIAAQNNSPASYAISLFALSAWTAAALSAVALLFALLASAPRRRTLMTRMSALGMSSRQAFALALFDPLSLLAVAIIGTTAAIITLALILRRVVDLSPLTSSQVTVPVQLYAPPIIITAACAIILALAAIAAEQLLARRNNTATALRTEETT
jgi:putative ABC transport system permease protein